MGYEFSRRVQRVFRVGPALVLTAMLALPQAADAKPSREPSPPVVVPPLEAALAGEPLDPRWPKRVFVITDSVMLGAKTAFPKSLPGWEVVFAGRPALMVDKATAEVRTHSNTGPVAVVALGYNTLWEKDRKDFQRWTRRFENHAEEMIATLKARGAKKIIWVTLREISSDNIPSGRVSVMQLNKYAYFFPYVNERLRELKKRHPELAIADWSRAAKRVGYTYDAIHINTRGAELLSETVKVAMGVDTNAVAPVTQIAEAPAPAPMPAPARAPEPQHIIELPRAAAPQPQRAVETTPRTIVPRQVRIDTIQVRATETPPNAQPQIMVEEAEPPRVVARSEEPAPPKRLGYRGRREAMFALSRISSASVVMLGDSLTERAQWSEILGCHFVANRGIGADDSAGVLRRLDDVTRLRPAAVFLMIGVNDVSSSVPAAKIVSNVRQTIEQLSGAGAQVYLQLVLPVTQGYSRQINGRIDELNAAYRTLAQETGAKIVDFRAQARTGDGHLRDEMSLDGIHLSTAGYRVWRDAIMPLVAQHCPAANDMRIATRAPIAAPQPRVVAAVVPSQAALPAVMAPPAPSPVARAYVAEAAPATTASVAPARGSWAIQIGAYPEEDKAKEKLREAQGLGASVLANASPFTEKTVKGSVELYRARFAGFSQSAAEAACSYFKRNAIDCITVRN